MVLTFVLAIVGHHTGEAPDVASADDSAEARQDDGPARAEVRALPLHMQRDP